MTEQEFDLAIAPADPVIVKFSAAWCGPCRLQFKYKDEILKINHLAEIERYPIGFCDETRNILYKLLKLRRKKYKT